MSVDKGKVIERLYNLAEEQECPRPGDDGNCDCDPGTGCHLLRAAIDIIGSIDEAESEFLAANAAAEGGEYWWAHRTPHVDCVMSARVRSKRRYENEEGTIIDRDDAGHRDYPWLVAWDDGTKEWCREGELRAPMQRRKLADR